MERQERAVHTQLFSLLESGRYLSVFAANLQEKGNLNPLQDLITPVFRELAPYMKNAHQILYIRDIPRFCIDGVYVNGDAYIENEAKITVPVWPVDEKQLRTAVAHELHHLTRWQTVGYGRTLGGGLLSEGFAVWYGIEKTGWTPPWAEVSISDEIKKRAQEEWDNPNYDHRNWFFGGTMERWVGYSLGYSLVRDHLHNHFDLKTSLWTKAEEVKGLV